MANRCEQHWRQPQQQDPLQHGCFPRCTIRDALVRVAPFATPDAALWWTNAVFGLFIENKQEIFNTVAVHDAFITVAQVIKSDDAVQRWCNAALCIHDPTSAVFNTPQLHAALLSMKEYATFVPMKRVKNRPIKQHVYETAIAIFEPTSLGTRERR